MVIEEAQQKPASKYFAIVPQGKPRVGKEPLMERLLAAKNVGNALAALLIMTNVFNVLQTFPEFWEFTAKLGKIIWLPPEEVRLKYPELYTAMLVLPSVVSSMHLLFQIAVMNQKKQAFPYFEGALWTINVILLNAALVTVILGFMVTKLTTFLLPLVAYIVLSPFAYSPRARRILKKANELAAQRGA